MFHLCIRWFLGIRQRDVTNNFKLLRKAVADGIALRSAGFGVNAELGIHAVRGGRSVAEVPVVWKGRGKDMGVSHFSIMREGFSYLTVFIRAVFRGKRGGA
jgi:dihydrodipicolinate reductase